MGESLRKSRLDRFVDDVIAPGEFLAPILDAFRQVDRAAFAPPEKWADVYSDKIIELQDGSTISQPTFVALIIEAADIQGGSRVLEIGAGTGYLAALLSHLSGKVYAIEYDEGLAARARQNLDDTGHGSVEIRHGDGALGLPDAAPFDRIIVSAALRDIPTALMEQLAVGGKIVAPLGEHPEDCELVLINKDSETEIRQNKLGLCKFVPLYSSQEGAWTKELLEQVEAERLERQRQPLKNWLAERWALHGVGYETAMARVSQEYADILGLEELTEGNVLDLIDYTFHIVAAPREEEKSEPSTDSSEEN